jgi:tetratricopeptide (TPR) repeat protein
MKGLWKKTFPRGIRSGAPRPSPGSPEKRRIVPIQSLKHTAFKLWAATAVAVPMSLWLLAQLNTAGGLAVPLAVLSVLFLLGYTASGWLASQLALRLVHPVLHEAGVWERSGEVDKAEEVYQKALLLYDSFLMAPAARRKGLPPLIARMARMYAAQTEKQEAGDDFLEHYLEIDPTDLDMAKTWLQSREYQGGITPHQQDLVARIGEIHKGEPTLQMTLARLYLQGRQTDFPALQTYRRAMSVAPEHFPTIAVDLSRVFIGEGRSDEWALPVYLQASQQQPHWEELRCGLAACLRWILPSERNAKWLAHAREIVGAVDEETLVRMSSGFVPPTGSFRIEALHEKHVAPGAGPARKGITAPLGQAFLHFRSTVGQLQAGIVGRVRRSPGLRRGITWSLITGLGVLAAVFLINTVGYLTPSPAPEPPPLAPAPSTPPAPPKPFTLQVAAYLKPEHAERYLESLRKQSIDAYVVRAHSNDKTWYQVRIAHFPDKTEALAYGSSLKAEGLIEDFYVARDQTP